MLDVKRITLVLSFLFFWMFVRGESTTLDSLSAQFLNENLSDRIRLDALISFGEDSVLLSKYPDYIIQYYEQADPLIENVGTIRDLMMQKLQLGGAYFIKQQYDESLIYGEDAVNLARITKDTVVLTQALMQQGNIYHQRNWYKLAAEKYLEALYLAETINYPEGIPDCLSNLGCVFHNLEDYDQALNYNKRALAIKQGQNEVLTEVKLLHKIGLAYESKKDYDQALTYYRKGLEKASKDTLLEEVIKAQLLFHIGSCYRMQEDLMTAKKYFQKALALQIGQAFLEVNIGAHIQLGQLYKDLSVVDSAMYHAQKAHTLAKGAKNLNYLGEVKTTLAELYEKRENYQKALTIYKACNVLQDSLKKVQNQEAVYQAVTRYEYEKRQSNNPQVYEQFLIQQKDKIRKRMYPIIGTIVVLILLMFGWVQFRQVQIKKERQQLLSEVQLWKQRMANELVLNSDFLGDVQLDKQKIESALGKNIGASSWKILTIIFENPSISNKDLAAQVHLSIDGLSSALRRMYKVFDVHSAPNRSKKVAMIAKAVKLSL